MNDFNFFDAYTGVKKDFKKEYFYAVIVSASLFLLIIFTYAFNYFNISKLNSEITNIQQNLNSKENIDKLNEIGNEEKKLAVMNKYYGVVSNISEGINNKDFVGNKVIDKINSCVPEGVNFKVMTLDANGVQIQAEAKDRETIAVFERTLRNLDFVKDIHIDIINSSLTDNKNFTFSVKCTLKDVDNNEGN
ncbi:PilN domain-containing protein [Clostridium estertheticum]|uniref:PilN domain-containing protein n=1 Tax=Clostridium estertheticum TaxID=238834 RepID=UPI001CF5A29A|nr:PilN domain-containing protein [Clostridium estertheticum]MCB2307950.1 PilN domain-containing protein [Clostridium estertheticum]MCB2346074.1 PilN domain-containing protein [Clostridium estertheticum]MCB2351332.1 PilN domain-containing protein [Clostridium estertheticum]WAG44217.1 PilN domain-containing protein [Clostridium estertheticum]